MRPAQFSADTLITLLRKQTIASLPEVIAALGARAAGARRSASSRTWPPGPATRIAAATTPSMSSSTSTSVVCGRSPGSAFPGFGTLIATAESFVSHAEAGHFGEELDNLLHVGTQDALRKLVRDGRLTRHQLTAQFLYCAADRPQQAQQLRARRFLLATPDSYAPCPTPT